MQVDDETEAIAGGLHRPLDDHVRAEAARRLLDRSRVSRLLDIAARDDSHVRHLKQPRRQRFDDAIADVAELFGIAEHPEGEDGQEPAHGRRRCRLGPARRRRGGTRSTCHFRSIDRTGSREHQERRGDAGRHPARPLPPPRDRELRGQLRPALRVHRHRRAAGVGRQRPQDLVGALESLGRVLREAAEDDFGHGRWRVRVDESRVARLGLHALQQLLDRRVALERHRAGDHLVEDQAESVEVDAVIDGSSFHLLRRHVSGRAEQLAGACHGGIGRQQRLREAEVRDVRGACLVDEDVVRLQVAMDHAFGVCRGERLRHLPGDADRARQRQAAFAAEDRVQVLAVHVGHRDELQALDVAEVVNPEDVLVRDLRAEQQLLLEALHGGGVGDEAGPDDLDGDVAIELAVVRLVDAAHPAFAEGVLDVVARAEDPCRAR